MGIPKSILGILPTNEKNEGYIFYYIPYSYFFKTNDGFFELTPKNEETGANAQNVL